MATHSMVTVAEARHRARKLVESRQRQWAATGSATARLDVILHPPTERAVQGDVVGAIAWTQSWRDLASTRLVAEVIWADRQWPSAGRQSVPERCVLVGGDAIAAFAGSDVARGWHTLRDRAARLREEFPDAADVPPASPEATVGALSSAVRTHAGKLQVLAEKDFETLIHVISWLAEHPTSGWRIRQLPIRGIDTKWLERHRSIVDGLHAAVTGRSSLGLLASPTRLRVRFLDPALRPGGICDVSSPIDELTALDIAPRTVFVFENLETVLAMPEMPDAVVVHGGGYAARSLSAVRWIQDGRVIYWGDLDSDGFAILHALRAGCSDVTSVLMDDETLFAYRDLWVPEVRPAAGVYPALTPSEQRTLEHIRDEGNIRLEQERIDWQFALEKLRRSANID